MADRTASAIELLRDIERRSRAHARGLPEQVEVQSTRAAVGFRVGEARLIAPLGVIREILTMPALTRVPGAKSWMKGVANVRGNLIPVTDLNGFLGGEATPMRRTARVLIVDSGPTSAGLLVDEVLGLRHFFEEEYSSDTSGVPEILRDYVGGIYRQDQQVWGSVDLHAVIESDAFMHVAA